MQRLPPPILRGARDSPRYWEARAGIIEWTVKQGQQGPVSETDEWMLRLSAAKACEPRPR